LLSANLIPALIINYKLKVRSSRLPAAVQDLDAEPPRLFLSQSVAHMSLKTMTYKVLSTVVDDLCVLPLQT
jgi:hypothetical protein